MKSLFPAITAALLLLCGLHLSAAPAAENVTIGPNYVILCRENPTLMERYTAETLQKYIARSTGMKLTITEKASSPAIRIAFDRNLQREEHLVKVTEEGDLLVSGGFPSGVIYGALDFLEKVMNCRFLAPDAEYVPRMEKITFPRTLVLRGVPAFLRRRLSPGPGVRGKQSDFHTKLRLSGAVLKTEKGNVRIDPYRFGNANGHAFHELSKNFPKNKPEYFSLFGGRRLRSKDGSGPGQLCLTNPEVRRLCAKNISRAISVKERRFAAEPEEKRQPPPYVYSLGKNDNRQDCACKNCLEALARYGGNHAGVMMDFVSDVAKRAGKVHEHVLFSFLVYTSDEFPVEGYKLPPNVMAVTAQLGSEFMTRTNRDSMRSIHHPNNAEAKKLMKQWRKSADHLGTWDYWILFRQHYAAPVTNVSALAENIRFYAGIKLENIYAETEIDFSGLISFIDLRLYVASKLMVDPAQDEKALIKEFMELYYGKAAPAMTRYLNYLEKRMREEKFPIGSVAPGARRYLDKAFYLQTEQFLAEAEKAAADSPDILRRIGQERILVDQWVLNEHKRLGIAADVKKLAARLRKNHRACAEKYTNALNAEKWIAQADAFIEACVSAPPLPEEFAKRKYFDFFGPKFIRRGATARYVKDPDSPAGKAWMLGPAAGNFHKRNLEFAVYDWVGKKHLLRKFIKKEEYPQDEKYHWYKVGKTRLTAKTQLIFHWSWKLSQPSGNAVFDPLEPDAEYEIYASVKLTGPSYVKGSKKEDGVYLDRVVFLECER